MWQRRWGGGSVSWSHRQGVVDRISNKVDLERKTADEQPKSPGPSGEMTPNKTMSKTRRWPRN